MGPFHSRWELNNFKMKGGLAGRRKITDGSREPSREEEMLSILKPEGLGMEKATPASEWQRTKCKQEQSCVQVCRRETESLSASLNPVGAVGGIVWKPRQWTWEAATMPCSNLWAEPGTIDLSLTPWVLVLQKRHLRSGKASFHKESFTCKLFINCS